MKIIESIVAILGLIVAVVVCGSMLHAIFWGMRMDSSMRDGYETNFQLDVIARKCVHTGYGGGRSSEKIYVCAGDITMRRGPGGFMERVK